MKIKVCGLTDVREAEYLNQNHVDYAGMVLYFPKSKRNISPEKAKEIMGALDDSIQKVAMVVSPSMEQIQEMEQMEFDFIQIHGVLPVEYLEQIRIPVLKAFNVTDMDQYEIYHKCTGIAGYVFDAQTPGSGKAFDWSLVQQIPRDEKLFILAGGLHPGNVAKAIQNMNPDVVDVSSGVEYDDRPGKALEKIKAFVCAARKDQNRRD